jgi:hypothetical protein
MKRLAILIMCSVWCGAAMAQAVSDVELQAAYCLGVSTAQLKSQEALLASGHDASTEVLLKEIEKSIAERQKRFRDYLNAKGFTQDRNPEKLRVALGRGSDDVPVCEREAKLQVFKECGGRCLAKIGEPKSFVDCTAKCPSPDSCTRVKKCLEDFLPF